MVSLGHNVLNSPLSRRAGNPLAFNFSTPAESLLTKLIKMPYSSNRDSHPCLVTVWTTAQYKIVIITKVRSCYIFRINCMIHNQERPPETAYMGCFMRPLLVGASPNYKIKKMESLLLTIGDLIKQFGVVGWLWWLIIRFGTQHIYVCQWPQKAM